MLLVLLPLDSRSVKLKVSMLEIYNGQLLDLLSNKERADKITLTEDKNGKVHAKNLTKHPFSSFAQLIGHLNAGFEARSSSETSRNKNSSRSHMIVTIDLKVSRKSDVDFILHSKLQLVDLAGSENAKLADVAKKQQLREGSVINRGLLALGNIIRILSSSDVIQHIPYRSSKLTRVLQGTIGGNCATIFVACVSPSAVSREESLSTLRYASYAKKIKNAPVQNKKFNLAEKIVALSEEVIAVKSKLDLMMEDNLKLKKMCNAKDISIQGLESAKLKWNVLVKWFCLSMHSMCKYSNNIKSCYQKVITLFKMLSYCRFQYDKSIHQMASGGYQLQFQSNKVYMDVLERYFEKSKGALKKELKSITNSIQSQSSASFEYSKIIGDLEIAVKNGIESIASLSSILKHVEAKPAVSKNLDRDGKNLSSVLNTIHLHNFDNLRALELAHVAKERAVQRAMASVLSGVWEEARARERERECERKVRDLQVALAVTRILDRVGCHIQFGQRKEVLSWNRRQKISAQAHSMLCRLLKEEIHWRDPQAVRNCTK